MRSRIFVAAIAVCLALGAARVQAYETGIAGFSGKTNQTCAACHAGGTAPTVRFEGPTAVAAGATARFRFVLVSEVPSQDQAGLDVAVSGGTLQVVSGQRTRLISREITHSDPKDIDDEEVSWELDWIAPTVAGEQTLYGAGNAVNGNGQTTGDRSRATTFKVQVGAATPTATATATVTEIATATEAPPPSSTVTPAATEAARTPTASVTPTATSEPGCVGDCDGDQRVTVAELVTGVNIALDRTAASACTALDRDNDQRVTVAELVAAVSRALEGC